MIESHIHCLSIVIPCLNEAENVRRFKKELVDYFQPFPFKKEFLFVDDGSSDNTHEVLTQLANEEESMRVIRHTTPQGMGAALMTGFGRATGDAVLTLDADLTFHPHQFPALKSLFKPDVDCVTGSAYRGEFHGVSFHRRFLSQIVNTLYSHLLSSPITSASSIFRLYRKTSLDKLNLECKDFDINAEIISKFLISRMRVIEVPVVLTQRIHGVSKINMTREIFHHLTLFLKILLWRIRMKV